MEDTTSGHLWSQLRGPIQLYTTSCFNATKTSPWCSLSTRQHTSSHSMCAYALPTSCRGSPVVSQKRQSFPRRDQLQCQPWPSADLPDFEGHLKQWVGLQQARIKKAEWLNFALNLTLVSVRGVTPYWHGTSCVVIRLNCCTFDVIITIQSHSLLTPHYLWGPFDHIQCITWVVSLYLHPTVCLLSISCKARHKYSRL